MTDRKPTWRKRVVSGPTRLGKRFELRSKTVRVELTNMDLLVLAGMPANARETWVEIDGARTLVMPDVKVRVGWEEPIV